nr:hypothetical protein [Salinigranum marinum]
MAVELAKVSLWINSAVEDKPLSFLDHRIKQGNSLIGTTPELMSQGVPVDAYDTSSGRDWHKGNEIRRRVRKENDNVDDQQQQVRLDRQWGEVDDDYVSLAEQLEQADEIKIEDVQEKERIYREFRNEDTFQREKLAHDVWTSAFYWPLDGSADEYPTPNTIEHIRLDPPEPSDKPIDELTGLQGLQVRASKIADEESFFHWPLEFPAVFSDGGFDCMIGNPPWESLEMRVGEFFGVRKPEIATAGTRSKRQKMIQELKETDPKLFSEYKSAKSNIESRVSFIKESGRYPTTSHGMINTYAPFAELATDYISGYGRSGIIVPTSLVTSSDTQEYFQKLLDGDRLVSLHDFENRRGLFPEVDSRYKFSLLTICGKRENIEEFELSFYLHTTQELGEEASKINMTREEIVALNPNTKTCPIFRNKDEAETTVKIYGNVGSFIDQTAEEENPWGVETQRMFHQSDDSGLFKTKDELDIVDQQTVIRTHENEKYIRFYESKYMHQYDHRFATYYGVESGDLDSAKPQRLPRDVKDDPDIFVVPRYWIPLDSYETKSGEDWHLALRKITNPTNERTVISTILPKVATGNSMTHIINAEIEDALLLMCSFNSFVLDYVARQKLGGNNLSQFITKQLPIPSPERFENIYYQERPVGKKLQELATQLVFNAHDLNVISDKNMDDIVEYNKPAGRQREEIRIEIEAIMCHIYDICEDDFTKIFDSFTQIKKRDEKNHGYFKTRDDIKEKYHEIEQKLTFN